MDRDLLQLVILRDHKAGPTRTALLVAFGFDPAPWSADRRGLQAAGLVGRKGAIVKAGRARAEGLTLPEMTDEQRSRFEERLRVERMIANPNNWRTR